MKTTNIDSYKRKKNITDKAQYNPVVNQLMEDNYSDLYQLLVKTDNDKGIFQDTFLTLTRTYNPDLAFMNEFARRFRNLKIEYSKKDSAFKFISLENAILKESTEDQE